MFSKRKDERGKKTACSVEACRKDWKGNAYDGKEQGVNAFNVGLVNNYHGRNDHAREIHPFLGIRRLSWDENP
jgi:hypothetical protein